MANTPVTVTGLQPLIRELKGPMLGDVNRELRASAGLIARDLVPHVADAIRGSGAPQAAAMAGTVRAHSDRVPVIVVGKTNPKLRNFRRKGQTAQQSKLRRGALAHGVVYGPKGGKRTTTAQENYYRIGRDDTGGPLGRALKGPIMDEACDVYLRCYASILRHHGFIGQSVKALHWNGRG